MAALLGHEMTEDEYDTVKNQLLSLDLPQLRQTIMERFPDVRAVAFIDANTGMLRTETDDIIAKIVT